VCSLGLAPSPRDTSSFLAGSPRCPPALAPVGLAVANGRIVRPVLEYKFPFDPEYFRVRRVQGLPEDLFPDGEVTALFPGEVLGDELALGAAKVVGEVLYVAADVDLSDSDR